MGACLSSSSSNESSSVKQNSALVISINGDLRLHPVPVTVSQVLQSESSTTSTTTSSSSSSFFVCNSDGLYYDEFVSPLDSDLELDAGQIYFILPAAKLRYRLSASDMAALAVKASLALTRSATSSSNNNNNNKNHNQSGGASKSFYINASNKARVSPFVVTESGSEKSVMDHEIDITLDPKRFSDHHEHKQQRAGSLGVSKTGSIRRLQRLSSRKARSAVRSFRLRLSTIYESSDPQLY